MSTIFTFPDNNQQQVIRNNVWIGFGYSHLLVL